MSQRNAGIPISDVTSQSRGRICAVSYNSRSARQSPSSIDPASRWQRERSRIFRACHTATASRSTSSQIAELTALRRHDCQKPIRWSRRGSDVARNYDELAECSRYAQHPREPNRSRAREDRIPRSILFWFGRSNEISSPESKPGRTTQVLADSSRKLASTARPAGSLGVKQLDRFHQGGCERLGKTEPLALRNRNRARIRADSDGDWNSDSIEACHIPQTGDANLRCPGRDPSQRIVRGQLSGVCRA